MLVLVGLLAVAAAVLWGSSRMAAAVSSARRDATLLQLQSLFAPAIEAAETDPRQLLTWYPLAQASRQLFPAEFSTLDRMFGGAFPVSREQVRDAHARWTAEWLAWERSHDGDYTLKTAMLHDELSRSGEATTAIGRARLAALEREKLERYNERYHSYVRTSKALLALTEAQPQSVSVPNT